MKRRLYLLLLSAALLFGLSACGPGPHVHMYGGMDSHGGPYYGAGWDYDSHHHGKNIKSIKRKRNTNTNTKNTIRPAGVTTIMTTDRRK